MKLDVDFIEILKFKKRPFRAKFNPQTVFLSLDRYKNNIQGLRHYLRQFKVSVERESDRVITVGGEFDFVKGRIVLYLYGDYESRKFTKNEWEMFKFRVIQTLMHEIIHWRQFEKRGHNHSKICNFVSEHKEAPYHSLKDEIQAYAHCIFLENLRDNDESYGGETYNHIFHTVFDHNPKNEALSMILEEIRRWKRLYSKNR